MSLAVIARIGRKIERYRGTAAEILFISFVRPPADVMCWGRGSSGRLGYGNTATVNDPSVAGVVPIGAGLKAVKVSCADEATCILTTNATVKCWGEASKWG